MPNWKKVIVSGSDAVLNSLNVVTALTASGLNYPTTDGLHSGQVIQTNAAGNLTFGDVNGIYQTIKNGEATSLTVGTVVYVSGSQGANPIVYRADAADPNKMPVQYIIPETITAGAIGRGLLLGILEGYNVGSAAAGTLLWVDGNGTLTTTRPTGSSDTTQPIAIVTKTGAGGQLSVLNPGPILLPNLQTGYTWIGNGDNYPIAVATSSIKNVVSSSYASASTSASYTLNATTASTASYVNTLNQNVLITGSLTIGSSSLGSNENTLILGPPPAGGAGEGGQILLQASGGLYTSASMWDNWQNYTRLLRGTNASSDAVVAQFNMHTKQVTFPQYNSSTAFVGTAAAYLAVDNAGNILTTSGSGGSGLSGGSANYVARWASSILLTTGSIYDSASRVGIGNTSPGYTLDVSGDIRSTGAVYANANGTMYFRGGDDAELWDVNIANTVGVYGQQDQGVASIKLGSGGGIISGRSSSIGIGTTTPISGALHVNGGVFANSFTGSFTGSHIGPLTGTASYATTASYSNTSTSSSYALNATTSSYALTATSASYSTNSTTASTASFVTTAQTASFYGGSVTSASYASNATTAQTASFVVTAQTASFVTAAQTASFVNPLNQNVIITGSASNSLRVKGSGATSATNTVYVENSSGQNTFLIKDDGAVTIDPGSGYTGNVLTLRSRNGTVGFYGDASSILRANTNFGVDGTLYLFGNISFQQLGTTITFNQNYLTGLAGINVNEASQGYVKVLHDYNAYAAQANQGVIVYSKNRTSGNYPQAAFQTHVSGNINDTAYLVSTRGFGYFRNSKADEPTLKLIASGGLAYTADYLQIIDSSSAIVAKINSGGSIWSSTYVSASSFTGSLLGTASTASFVTTAQTASFVTTAQTASYVKTAQTASFINTLNQNVLITGSLTVGATSLGSNENTLVLGPSPAGGTGEGGQILLQAPGGIYTSASMWDNYQNLTRLLRGTNNSSDAVVASFDMHSKQVQFAQYNSTSSFTGTVVGLLGFDSNGMLLTTTASSGGGSGTVNNGTAAKLAYYPSTGTTVDDAANLEYDGTNLKILSTAQLDFYTNAGSIYFGTFGSPTYGRAGFSVPGQAVMVVDYSNARAGFGGGTSLITSAPAGLVEIQGKTDEIQLLVKGNGTQTNNILEIQKSTGAILYYLDNNGDAKLASGSLGVGIAPNGTDGRIDASNDIVAFSTSDINWKTNIKPIKNAIDKVKQISGNTFDWIEDTNPVGKIHGNKGKDIGVIAQEIEKVLPEIVTTRESGTKAVKYEKIVALLIEAIKEQQQQIDELKSKLK